eukprot:RCo033662
MSNGMFKKFSKEVVQSKNLPMGSVQKAIRRKLAEQFPMVTSEEWEFIMPKKEAVYVVKCQNHISLVVNRNRILFFQDREGPYLPVLRLLHEYPFLLPRLQIDIGGCKYVIGGANVMCPGLTSPGARMPECEIPEGAVVGIFVEGKEHAVAVGVLNMSTAQIRKVNKGPAVENLHYMGDGLWHHPMLTD